MLALNTKILKSYYSMKTLAKYHVCNHCVIGEKTFQNILIGHGKLPGLSRNGPPGLKINGSFWQSFPVFRRNLSSAVLVHMEIRLYLRYKELVTYKRVVAILYLRLQGFHMIADRSQSRP